jgi:hypothetical protein
LELMHRCVLRALDKSGANEGSGAASTYNTRLVPAASHAWGDDPSVWLELATLHEAIGSFAEVRPTPLFSSFVFLFFIFLPCVLRGAN